MKLIKNKIPLITLLIPLFGITLPFGCTKKPDQTSPLSQKPIDLREDQKEYYRCPMHAQVHSENPGECPICHMKLEKVKAAQVSKGEKDNSEKKIKYYRNPMDPSIHSDHPSKDNMGMDYIPVYEKQGEVADDNGRAAFSLSPEQTKLSGSKQTSVEKRDLTVEIRIPGRVLGGTRVSFQAYELDSALIKPGLEFEAETPSAQGQILTGKVTFVDSILDPMTRTVRVDGIISSGSKSPLKTEASVVGRLKIKIPGVLSIPEDAVIHTGMQNLVYVSDGQGGFSPRRIELGVKANERYEVKSGLTEGEKISAGPNFLLDSESRIESSQ